MKNSRGGGLVIVSIRPKLRGQAGRSLHNGRRAKRTIVPRICCSAARWGPTGSGCMRCSSAFHGSDLESSRSGLLCFCRQTRRPAHSFSPRSDTTMNAPDKLPASPEPHVMKTYGRLPVALSHGRGCWLWDTEGRKYLDALAGIAVNTLGHGHPKLGPALPDQVSKLIHSSNYYLVPLQEQLAAKLCELSGMSNVFFCNSGME